MDIISGMSRNLRRKQTIGPITFFESIWTELQQMDNGPVLDQNEPVYF